MTNPTDQTAADAPPAEESTPEEPVIDTSVIDEADAEGERSGPLTITVVSDFICPWCYVGLTEIERLYRNWEIELDWLPFFLDPSIPPEGRTRSPQGQGGPETPLEARGKRLGLEFPRGRAFTPHTILSLQASEFARAHGTTEQVIDFHRRLFYGYFTEFENLMEIDMLVGHAEEAGLDGPALRQALTAGTYLQETNEAIEQAYSLGVEAIPTFVIAEKYAVVGAQEYDTLERVMEQLQVKRREVPLPDPRA